MQGVKLSKFAAICVLIVLSKNWPQISAARLNTFSRCPPKVDALLPPSLVRTAVLLKPSAGPSPLSIVMLALSGAAGRDGDAWAIIALTRANSSALMPCRAARFEGLLTPTLGKVRPRKASASTTEPTHIATRLPSALCLAIVKCCALPCKSSAPSPLGKLIATPTDAREVRAAIKAASSASFTSAKLGRASAATNSKPTETAKRNIVIPSNNALLWWPQTIAPSCFFYVAKTFQCLSSS